MEKGRVMGKSGTAERKPFLLQSLITILYHKINMIAGQQDAWETELRSPGHDYNQRCIVSQTFPFQRRSHATAPEIRPFLNRKPFPVVEGADSFLQESIMSRERVGIY